MKRILAMVNPQSGNGKGQAALEELRGVAASHGVSLDEQVTSEEGEARRFLKTASLEGVDTVVSLGGDGTLNEVVNGLYFREDPVEVPLGILPCGTGNSLMTDLGAAKLDLALKDLFAGKRFHMDLFQIERDGVTQVGFNMIGCGLPSMVNRYAERARWFRRQRYNVGILQAWFRYRKQGLRCMVQGEEITTDFLVATNTKTIGSGIRMSPDAALDDGLLDLWTLTDWNKRSLIPLLIKLSRGTHPHDPRVTHRQVTEFEVQAPEPDEVNLDGDQLPFQHLRVCVLPKRITLMHQPTSVETS